MTKRFALLDKNMASFYFIISQQTLLMMNAEANFVEKVSYVR